jgi:hypothetical protein
MAAVVQELKKADRCTLPGSEWTVIDSRWIVRPAAQRTRFTAFMNQNLKDDGR